jgi:hypothetical protein
LLGQGTADIGNWTMDMLAGSSPATAMCRSWRSISPGRSAANVALREVPASRRRRHADRPGLVEQFLPGADGEARPRGHRRPDRTSSGEQDVPPVEVIDRTAGAEDLTTAVPEEVLRNRLSKQSAEIVPETSRCRTGTDRRTRVEEQPAAEVEPGADAATEPETEPTAEPELAPAEEPIVEEPVVEEPAAEEAPGASGLTTEPVEPAVEEQPVPADEPVVDEAPGASDLTTEPVPEPSAEPAAPGSDGVAPGTEPLPETQSQDTTEQDPAQLLLQGIISTDQQ